MKAAQACLMTTVEEQLMNLDKVDAKELGEAIDMIKDLEEAIYYETITKAMNKKTGYEEDEWDQYYPKYYGDHKDKKHPDEVWERDRKMPTHDGHMSEHVEEKMHHDGEKEYPHMRDSKEGKSPMSRRMYMESKEKHHDKASQMRELENYMQELTQDIVEMVEGST